MTGSKKDVALLGATGTVGQKVIRLLENHPVFQIAEMAASERSVGKTFFEAQSWRESTPPPKNLQDFKLIHPLEVSSPYVISALPADQAKTIEPALAEKGLHVVSNASAHRLEDDVPLVIPEVNPSHLGLLTQQKSKGKILTNPNCSTVFIALALAPLKELGVIESVSITTLQALSGAGYPGLCAMDVMDNIIPYIGGEEEKIVAETKKILGNEKSPWAEVEITCHVNRVPIRHGHTAVLHLKFSDKIKLSDVEKKYRQWNERFSELFVLHGEKDRPQPRYDIHDEDQSCHVGRIKQGQDERYLGLIAQGHNLVRGAAGAAVLNLELLHNFFNDRGER